MIFILAQYFIIKIEKVFYAKLIREWICFIKLDSRIDLVHKFTIPFLWLQEKGRAIFLILECHSNTNQEHIWKQGWDGEIFSLGESNCRGGGGVAILVTKNLDVNIDSIKIDKDGIFSCDYRISSIKHILVNLYAPIADKKLEQNNFGSYVHSNLENYTGKNIIIGGELNITLDTIRHNFSPSGPTYSEYMLLLLGSLHLVDIWRLHNPDILRYTW